MDLFSYLLGYAVIVNVITFLTMGVDKRKAIQQKWRVPEKTIWLLSIAGGAVGGYAGMKFFRHKTRHHLFKYGLPVLAVLQLMITGCLLDL